MFEQLQGHWDRCPLPGEAWRTQRKQLCQLLDYQEDEYNAHNMLDKTIL